VVDLAALLDPVRSEDFFANHWERKPLMNRRGDARYYDALLSGADLDRFINSSDLRYPALQLARDGAYMPPEAYTRPLKHGSEVFAAAPDMEKVRAEYRSGATVVLPALQRAWAPLRKLCDTLEKQLSHAVHANAYLTPGGAQGFTPHYDTHEVFVLQIAGQKRWRIGEPPVLLPHPSQPFSPAAYAPTEPVMEIELNPGDLLYLPRGYVHSASTARSHSAHVTIGVTVFTWVELLSELLQSSKHMPACREALPVGFATREDLRGSLEEGLARRLEALLQQTDRHALIESFARRVRLARPRPAREFRSDARVIGPRTVLAAPARHRYAIASENGNTTLELDGRKLLLPAGVRPTLDAICERASFRPEELPGDLDRPTTLAFLRFLDDEGFLEHLD
jgi:ribosomal protein L16 Arg81 hydroxylase